MKASTTRVGSASDTVRRITTCPPHPGSPSKNGFAAELEYFNGLPAPRNPTMKARVPSGPAIALLAAIFVGIGALTYAEPPEKPAAKESGDDATASASEKDDPHRLPYAVARDRARVMHDVYAATLDVIHHRYFHGDDKAAVPARAMEDVFAQIERQSSVEARWIAVNMKAMSIDHKPETAFEKQAARQLAAGKGEFEAVEDGYYRRAGAIPLNAGCISCHGGFFRGPIKSPRFAGLVISIPIEPDTAPGQ